MSFAQRHLAEVAEILKQLDCDAVERVADALAALRNRGGRLFVLGAGGSAANASHFVNDLRKLCSIEAYAPTDNVAELTARVNDDGWETTFVEWLRVSRLASSDAVFVLSVGGGSLEPLVSPNIVRALQLAEDRRATILGIVGRDGGYTARAADAVVVIPTVNPKAITPHTEAFQAVVWHLLVSHPKLCQGPTKWEGLA